MNASRDRRVCHIGTKTSLLVVKGPAPRGSLVFKCCATYKIFDGLKFEDISHVSKIVRIGSGDKNRG